MRIIAGMAKGRRLVAPKGLGVRPTPARVREAVFDILGEWILGTTCLDVFAGTGAIAAEALSRGAKAVVILEKNPEALDALAKNLEVPGFSQNCWKILPGDAVRSLMDLTRQHEQFDFIYLDPPYAFTERETIVELAAHLVKPSGWVVLEHLSKLRSPMIADLERCEKRKFGDTSVTFYQSVNP